MTETPKQGDRIAKVIARAGITSRREAERLIEAGRVSVNGKTIDSPALNVTPQDRVVVDGKPLAAPEPPRVWLYHKPTGLVSTNSDEQGRETIFDALPPELPRVMSVGRLDLNSEGLLLLTNDGGVKRKLELPSTGWLRRYRVRVNGRVDEPMLDPLRRGIVADGERFQPMEVTLDRQQGANAWLTIGIREGKNREIRRAMEEVGLNVNRLIRVSYGPFQLGNLARGAVEEVRRKILRDQLGLTAAEMGTDTGDDPAGKPAGRSVRRPARGPAKPTQGTSRAGGPGPAGKGAGGKTPGPRGAGSGAPQRGKPGQSGRPASAEKQHGPAHGKSGVSRSGPATPRPGKPPGRKR